MRVVPSASVRGQSIRSVRRLILNPLPLHHELRLRRWTRERYVEAGERSSAWHPAILEEMATREAELNAAQTVAYAYRRAA